MTRRHRQFPLSEIRGALKRGASDRARSELERTIGAWFFRQRFGPGPRFAPQTDVCIVIGGDDDRVALRGNGRTRRVSWPSFAAHWRPWQGDPMPRPGRAWRSARVALARRRCVVSAASAFDELDAALRAHDEAQWDYALAPDGTDESSEAHDAATRGRARLDAAIAALRALAGVPR